MNHKTSSLHLAWLFLAVCLGAFVVTTASADPAIFWADGGVSCSNLDGSGTQQLVTTLPWSNYQVISLALDRVDRKIYWSNGRSLFNANLDGSATEQILEGCSSRALAVDEVNRKVYWAEYYAIKRANLDGTVVETLISLQSPPISYSGFDVDPYNGKMYFSQGREGLWAANLDGSSLERIPLDPEVQKRIRGVAVHPFSGKLYLADEDYGIRWMNIDGTQEELIAEHMSALSGWPTPTGVDLDLASGKVYWSESYSRYVRRADLDGSNIENVLATGGIPWQIAVVPEPAVFSLAAVGGLAMVRRKRRQRSWQ